MERMQLKKREEEGRERRRGGEMGWLVRLCLLHLGFFGFIPLR